MASVLSSGTMTAQGGQEELPPGFRFFPTDEDKEIFRGLKKTLVLYSDERQTGVDDSDDAMRIVVEDGRIGQGGGDQDEADQFRSRRSIIPEFPPRHPLLCVDQRDSALCNRCLNMGTPKEEDSVHCSVGAPKALVSVCDAAFHEMCPSCLYLRWLLDSIPSNVLLDEEMDNQLSDFGLPSRLLHANDYTQISRGSWVPTHNGSLDAKFLGKPSAKHGIEKKTGSHMTHRRTYFSVHYHPLIKMWPSARKWSGDILTSCARLITSKWTFGDIFTGWISAKPKYKTPNAGPVSEYIIRELFGIRNELTVKESQQHSDRDSRRAENTKTAATSASWLIATAAPHHATGDRNLLSGFTMEHDDLFVHAVNRVPMKVLARGAVVTDALILPDVWFVPGLTENLVSVSQLAELDHSIGFGRGECCIRSAPDAKIIGKGRLQKDGQYVLDYLKVPLAI